MSTQVKLRRGTAAQIAAFTPAEAEPIYDQTNKTLRVGDGSTLGGANILATQAWVATQLTGSVADGSLTPAKFANTSQNTMLGRIASGSGAPSWLSASEGRQALGMTSIGSGVATAADMPAALAAQGISALARALWGMAR